MRFRSAFALLTLLVAPACGNGQRDLGDAVPECSDVWVAGRTLPADYTGCREFGAVVRPDRFDCPDSDDVAVKFGDYFGILGGEIVGGDPDTTLAIHC